MCVCIYCKYPLLIYYSIYRTIYISISLRIFLFLFLFPLPSPLESVPLFNIHFSRVIFGYLHSATTSPSRPECHSHLVVTAFVPRAGNQTILSYLWLVVWAAGHVRGPYTSGFTCSGEVNIGLEVSGCICRTLSTERGECGGGGGGSECWGRDWLGLCGSWVSGGWMSGWGWNTRPLTEMRTRTRNDSLRMLLLTAYIGSHIPGYG